MSAQKQKKNKSGFTIVELLIVIVIIAILAGIVIVAYNGIQRNTVASTLQNTLSNTAKALEVAALDTNSYETFPASITIADQVGIALTQVDNSSETYCINATTPKYDNLTYHLKKGSSPSSGLCQGAPTVAIGSYNYAADSAANPSTTMASAVTVTGDKYNFKVATNDTWSQVMLTWSAQSEATQWQLQARLLPSGAWFARSSAGTSGYSETNMTGSNVLSSATTSQTWTSGGFPTTIGQTYEYRLRYKKADASYSEWSTVALAPLANRPIPKITNFTVKPDATWSRVSITWDAPGTFANMPGIIYQLQHRASPTSAWFARSSAGTSGYSETSMTGSNVLSPMTTSQTWTSGGFPTTIGQTHEYRIRIASSSDVNTYGEWAGVSLSPIASSSDIPKITGLTATPSSNWSQVVISWDSLGSFANMPGIVTQLQARLLPNGAWFARSSAGTSGYSETNMVGSNVLSPTTTSQTWTSGGFPTTAGQAYEYRIRIASSSDANTYGEWVTLSLNRQ